MSEAKKNNPFESVSPDIISSLNSCSMFYLKNTILQIIIQNPEMADNIKDLLSKANTNQENDKINDLLAKAGLPGYPEHHKLTDFNPACLSKADRTKYEELSGLCFLTSEKKPNVLLHGLAGQGRDKIAIGLGDLCCRKKMKVIYIPYTGFVEVLRTRGTMTKTNTFYEKMMKTNCLIIDNFAGKLVYDEDILDAMTDFIQARAELHRDNYIQHKHDSGKPFVPYCTIATSSFEPAEWTKHMKQDPVKTFALARFFYQNFATIIHVDETNDAPANAG